MKGRRIATVFLLVAIALLAVGFRYVLRNSASFQMRQWMEPAQRLLLLLALGANALANGVHRRLQPWPVYVVGLMVLETLLLMWMGTSMAPGMNGRLVFFGALALSTPWLFPLARLERGTRRAYATLIALLPTISVVVGTILYFLGNRILYSGRLGAIVRLQGATKGDYFAAMAYAGVLVAVHEWVRNRRGLMGSLIFVNLIYLIFSGGRMALFATVVGVVVYFAHSPVGRDALWKLRGWAYLGAAAVGAAMVAYAPMLADRMTGLGSDQFNFSGRRAIWADYLDHFLVNPWLGRGLGAGQEGILNRAFPHNEYLRVLVEGGVFAAALFLAAVVLWSWHLHRRLSAFDRPFLVAFMVSVGIYAFTDNPLSATYLSGFVYLGVMLIEGEALPWGEEEEGG